MEAVLEPMIPFHQFIDNCTSAGQKYICHCYSEISKLDFFTEANQSLEEDILVLVGPEGDFSFDEVRYAREHGFKSVTLGESRLRTETAGLFAVMISQLARRV